MSTKPRRITLTKDGEWWVAKDLDTGVASQGPTRTRALEMLDEAVALHTGDGEPVEDEESFLEEVGIDPDEIPEEPRPLPDFLR
ncbi:MAG: type II toxin-antitoxin system HicB family antitoxin [Halobacteriales archaeon]